MGYCAIDTLVSCGKSWRLSHRHACALWELLQVFWSTRACRAKMKGGNANRPFFSHVLKTVSPIPLHYTLSANDMTVTPPTYSTVLSFQLILYTWTIGPVVGPWEGDCPAGSDLGASTVQLLDGVGRGRIPAVLDLAGLTTTTTAYTSAAQACTVSCCLITTFYSFSFVKSLLSPWHKFFVQSFELNSNLLCCSFQSKPPLHLKISLLKMLPTH